MENKDKPAYPVTLDWCIVEKKVYTTTEKQGLTKREMFAMAAMQGILAKHGLPSEWTDEDLADKIKSVSIASVIVADQLLKQLESKPI